MAVGDKQPNRPNRDLIKNDPGQAEKHPNIGKYIPKLIKYSPSTTKSAIWGSEGAPKVEFGRLGTVFNEFGIVFVHFVLLFGLARVCLMKSGFRLFDCFWGPPF